jgi:hypothetical protein
VKHDCVVEEGPAETILLARPAHVPQPTLSVVPALPVCSVLFACGVATSRAPLAVLGGGEERGECELLKADRHVEGCVPGFVDGFGHGLTGLVGAVLKENFGDAFVGGVVGLSGLEEGRGKGRVEGRGSKEGDREGKGVEMNFGGNRCERCVVCVGVCVCWRVFAMVCGGVAVYGLHSTTTTERNE